MLRSQAGSLCYGKVSVWMLTRIKTKWINAPTFCSPRSLTRESVCSTAKWWISNQFWMLASSLFWWRGESFGASAYSGER